MNYKINKRIRKTKREYMRRARLDPIKRERWNKLKRDAWQEKWGPKQKIYLKKIKSQRFFFWTARLFNIHYKIKYSANDFAKIWKKQKGICPLSGLRLNAEIAHLDHIIPISKKGSHSLKNLRWVHKDVNYAKRNLLDKEFITLCKLVVNQCSRMDRKEDI